MAEVGSAFVSILPSARGFGSKLESEVGGEVAATGSSVGSKFGTALKVGALAVAGGAVLATGFLKGAIGEAREAQKVAALTNAVIKSTGGVANVTAKQVDELATAISLKTGVDDEAIAAGENMLLTFSNVRNEVGKGNDIFSQATVAATDMAAAFGGDAVSNSKMLGKALNDPIAGVSALTRVGVSFTQQQKDQIKTLQESGDILGAQKIILGEVSKQTAGAAEAQATAGEKLKVVWDNFRESIGTALLPILDQAETALAGFVTMLTNDIGPGLAALNGYLAPAIASTRAFFASFSGNGAGTSSLMQFAQAIVTNFLPVMQRIGTTLTTQVIPSIVRFASYMKAQLGPVFVEIGRIVSTQVVPIVASFARFVATTLWPALVRISQQVAQNLRPAFEQLVATFRAKVLPAVEAALIKFREWQPTIQKVIGVLVVIIGKLIDVQTTIVGKVLPVIIRLIAFMGSNLVKAIGTAIGVIAQIIAKIIEFGQTMVDGGKKVAEFANSVKDKINEALAVLRSLPSKAASAVGDLGSLLYAKGQELIQGLINGIVSKLGDIAGAMGKVAGVIKDHLPGSPVKRGPLVSWNNGGAGKRLIDMLVEGLRSGTPAVEKAMVDLTQKVVDRLQEGVDHFKEVLSGLRNDMASLAQSIGQAFATNLFDATSFDSFLSSAVDSNGNLAGLMQSFRKLKRMGAGAGFLSDLFASGNQALIADLAGGPKSDVRLAQAYYTEQQRLLGQLGNQVARNEYGPRIDRISGQLGEISKDIKQLAPALAHALSKPAGDAKRKRG